MYNDLQVKRRFLLDCDEVLAEFNQAVLDLVKEKTGEVHTVDELVDWDVMDSIGLSHMKHIVEEAAECGLAATLNQVPGSWRAVRRLEEMGDVYIVTAPMRASRWVGDRVAWLHRELAVPRERVVFTQAKHIIDGDALVDDRTDYLLKWADEHPSGLALLWDEPYNRDVQLPKNARRVKGWLQALWTLENEL